ncbi:MAG: hypothetical protein GYB65_00860 [Chloroflexi bacterium]|nr:hypothetical protein [Chloroflexota bacterium]
MQEPAYIAIGPDGHVTLYWGDGTEEEKYVILRGPRATGGQELAETMEDLKAWAEDNGYVVVVPSYDLEATPVTIDIPAEEVDAIDLDEVDDLLDDLFDAGHYGGNYDDDDYDYAD